MSKLPLSDSKVSKMNHRSFISTGVGLGVLTVISNYVFAAKNCSLVKL